ncbi:Uncharacterised protein [Salmonella enterica subsp. enterica serovar Typhi]|nr:Uncharacterised protein [Salmonella enterica subsp. enterica serovar Typhi]CGI92438.1 Uncharacterised protein [Salmonella enterica subsp. enterica serovar Typhi]CGO94446.1 Uncharacterised protein [Salmonella enterica subsp. enterica serovar Typhi]CGZ38142.1 Uncharacterised protein [Salmonella enterica subsp. enterica serovar Typhi]CHD02796.1 Uncharacterised protein [Salmonella enterica subsp. enterica serovar Typhi]
MRRLGAHVGNNDQIGIKTLLLARRFGMVNQPILLHFTLDRITGFIEEIALPDLIAQRLTAQLLLLVIHSVKSDQV